jgi:hypothetical protein
MARFVPVLLSPIVLLPARFHSAADGCGRCGITPQIPSNHLFCCPFVGGSIGAPCRPRSIRRRSAIHPQATLGCGESVDAQVRQLTKAGCKKVFTPNRRSRPTAALGARQRLRLMVTLIGCSGMRRHSSTSCPHLVQSRAFLTAISFPSTMQWQPLSLNRSPFRACIFQ